VIVSPIFEDSSLANVRVILNHFNTSIAPRLDVFEFFGTVIAAGVTKRDLA